MFRAILLALFAAGVATAQVPDVKYNFDFVEKTHGLKFKSGGPKAGVIQVFKGDPRNGYVFLLEFTRDVTGKDLDNVRKLFRPISNESKDKAEKTEIVFHLFDEDNVSLAPYAFSIHRCEGAITGVKGDAFRVIISDVGLKDKVRKTEARQVNPEAKFEEIEINKK